MPGETFGFEEDRTDMQAPLQAENDTKASLPPPAKQERVG